MVSRIFESKVFWEITSCSLMKGRRSIGVKSCLLSPIYPSYEVSIPQERSHLPDKLHSVITPKTVT
jgi:hypothetical protein